MVLMFNDSKDNAADIVRLEGDKFDEKYQALDKSTKDEIVGKNLFTLVC